MLLRLVHELGLADQPARRERPSAAPGRRAGLRAPRRDPAVGWFFAKLEAEGYLDATGRRSPSRSTAPAVRCPRETRSGQERPGPRDRCAVARRPFAVVRAMVEHVAGVPARARRPGKRSSSRPAPASPLVRLLLQRQPALPDQQPSRSGSRRAGAAPAPRHRPGDRRRIRVGGARRCRAPGAGRGDLPHRALPVHRDRPDFPPPRRAGDQGAVPRPARRVRAARHGPGFRGPGHRARERGRRLRGQHDPHRPGPRGRSRADPARR